jgi:hypothetical protein
VYPRNTTGGLVIRRRTYKRPDTPRHASHPGNWPRSAARGRAGRVRAETRRHDYDEVILATRRQGGSWLARSLHLDPVHQLQRRWGQHLAVVTVGSGTKPDQ